ncbi:MAG: Ig-like domain repeat protein, partial [Acidobacteriaceae bacterium]|nr:Ig-like domain repeat protein [Acidobacteriaceae bacterium]
YTGFSGAPPASGTYKPNISSAFTSYCGDYPSSPTYSNGTPPPAYDAAATRNCPEGGDANTTFASNFSGGTPFGTWVLFVYTNNTADATGTVASWSLNITPSVAAGTSTALSSSAANSESFSGSAVTFTATVTSGGNPVTTSTVTFTDAFNGSTLCNAVAVNGSGQATCSVNLSGEGNHVITATYAGDSSFATSSGSLTQVVDNKTVVNGAQFCDPGTVSFGNNAPTTVYPQNVFVGGLTGSVTGVTLALNNINAYPSDLDVLLVAPNGAKFVPLADAGGISSRVNGITLTLADTAAAHVPTTGLSASGTYLPTDYKPNIAFTAPAPAGPYQLPFNQGSATFAATFASANVSGPVSQTPDASEKWSLYINSLTPSDVGTTGGYCLTFLTSSLTATNTAVSATPSPATTGEAVTFTATVTNSGNGTPVTSGTITFQENGTVISGPTALNSSGQASFQTSSLAEGIHTITALYSGVPNTYNVSSGTTSVEVDTPTTITGSTYCNPGGVSIAASSTTAAPYPSRVNVTGLAGTVNSVSVSLDTFDAVSPEELVLVLTGPSGTNIGFLDDAGGFNNTGSINVTFADGGNSLTNLNTELANNTTYAPTANNNLSTITLPSPAPANISYAAPLGSQTFTSAFQSIPPSGYWSLFAISRETNEGMSLGKWCLNFTENAPVLSLNKTHTGSFTQGDTGDTYTITVKNNGPGSTAGTLTLTDTLPTGLTLVSLSQTGHTGGGTGCDWSCTGATCTRTTPMTEGEVDTLTLTAAVTYNAATGTNSVTNSVSVSGGGISVTQTATDPTTINQGQGYTLTTAVSPSGSGTVRANPANSTGLPAGHYVPGAIVQLIATPNAGYSFSSWSGSADLSSTTTAQTTITMNSPAESVTANFAQTYTNVTGSVQVTNTGAVYSRATRLYSVTFTVQNTTSSAINGPVNLVLTGLPSGITATNSTGTFNGNPYWTVSGGSVSPGASVSVTVSYSDPSGASLAFTPQVYSGSF